MRTPKLSRQFKKDYKKLKKSGRYNLDKLELVMALLITGGELPKIYKDHPLHGEWKNRRDCHIESDWVLIYELIQDIGGNEIIIFHATDNHSNLFK